jgi:hypothetical protein
MIRLLLRDYLQTLFPSVTFTVDYLPATTALCCALIATAGTSSDGKFAIDEVGIQFLLRGEDRQTTAQTAETLYRELVSAKFDLPPYRILSVSVPSAGPVFVGVDNGLSYYSINAVLLTARTGSAAGYRQEA